MTNLPRLLLILCSGFCLLSLASGEEPALSAETADSAPAEPTPAKPFKSSLPSVLMSPISSLYDIVLPLLDPPGTYKLHFNPQFGDLIRRGYIRTDAGLDWALNNRFGVGLELETYATHGLRSANYGYGIGQVRVDSKYVFKGWPKPEYESSVGFSTLLTVDHPPVDMTDGLNHFTPNFAIQYHPPAHPRWTTFGGANIDFVANTKVLGTPAINTPRDDSFSIIGGAIYDMGQVKWTLQGTYTTTALIGNATQNYYSVRPSLLWYAPKRFTFHSKTQWIFGVGLNATWGPDGFNLSDSSRVRAEITFRQVLDKIRHATKPPSDSPP